MPTSRLRQLTCGLALVAAIAGCAAPAATPTAPAADAAPPVAMGFAPPVAGAAPPPLPGAAFGSPRMEKQPDDIVIKGKHYSREKLYQLAQTPGYRANPWTLGAYAYTFPVDAAGNEAPPDQQVAWWFGGEGAMTQTSKYIPEHPSYFDAVENRYIYQVLTLNYKVPDDQVLILSNCRVYYYATNTRLPRRWPRWAEWWWGFWIGSGIVLPRPEELPADVQTAYSDYWWLGNYTPTSTKGSDVHMVFGPGQNVPASFSFWRYKNHHMYPIIQGNTLHTNMIGGAFVEPK